MSSGLALHVPPHGQARVFFNSVTVSKAPLLQSSTRIKPATESQKALSCFLDRRRAIYQARQRKFQHCQVSSSGNSSSNPSANTSSDFADNELSVEHLPPLVVRASKIKVVHEISRTQTRSLIVAAKDKRSHCRSKSALYLLQAKNQLSDFINIDSEELAERVVSKAKLRLKGKQVKERKRNSITNREMLRTSTPIPPVQNTNSKVIKFAISKTRLHKIHSQPNITGEKTKQSLFSQNRCNKWDHPYPPLPIGASSLTKPRKPKDVDIPPANFLKISRCRTNDIIATHLSCH